ncbi:MAG: hypothetical protein DMF62_04615 [Acidobacteria bacterium]|nr:MAG: hypothetical protein DMF62_04615 [Acidobacteriota bacterium]
MLDGYVPPVQPHRKYLVKYLVRAQYEGRCRKCSGAIDVGDSIGYAWEDDLIEIGWCCTNCCEMRKLEI